MADLSQFHENFNEGSLDTGIWYYDSFYPLNFTGSYVNMPGDGTLQTTEGYAFASNNALRAEIVPTEAYHTWQFYLQNPNETVLIGSDGTNLTCYYSTANGSNQVIKPYDPVAMRFVRFARYIPDTNGSIEACYLETSPDGSNWTEHTGVQIQDNGWNIYFQHGGEVNLYQINGSIVEDGDGQDGTGAFNPSIHIRLRLMTKLGSSGNVHSGTPQGSLGGYVSYTRLGTGAAALFDDIVAIDNAAKTVNYRAVALVNTHGTLTLGGTVVWVRAKQINASILTIGGDPAAVIDLAGGQVQTIADQTSTPASVSFSTASSQGSGIAIGNLPPRHAYVFWVRRAANNTPAGTDGVTFGVSGTAHP